LSAAEIKKICRIARERALAAEKNAPDALTVREVAAQVVSSPELLLRQSGELVKKIGSVFEQIKG
jgi:hypothetical protein